MQITIQNVTFLFSPSNKGDHEVRLNNNWERQELHVHAGGPLPELACKMTKICDTAKRVPVLDKACCNGFASCKPAAHISLVSKHRNRGQHVREPAKQGELATTQASPTSQSLTHDILHCMTLESRCLSGHAPCDQRGHVEATSESCEHLGTSELSYVQHSANNKIIPFKPGSLCTSHLICNHSKKLLEPVSQCAGNSGQESLLLHNQIVVKAEIHEEPRTVHVTSDCMKLYKRQSSTSSSESGDDCTLVQLGENGQIIGSIGSVSLLRANGSSDTSRSTTPNSSSTGSNRERNQSATCRWQGCGVQVTDGDLKEHLSSCHMVAEQHEDRTMWVCRWEGCRVYGCPASSEAWLQRHILQHSGQKPFRCIVDGCGQRFASDAALSRHVNSHFSMQQTSPAKTQRCREDTTGKTYKKRTKLKRRKSFLGESLVSVYI